MRGTTTTERTDIHQTVTNKIIAAIEAGAGDWKMPWHRPGSAFGLPTNVATGKNYRGVNIISLWVEAEAAGFSRPVWGTYRQWQEAGAQVRKGETSSLVVFYKPIDGEQEAETGEDTRGRRLFARASHVFNAAQVDGYDVAPEAPRADLTERLDHAEHFITATGARIEHGGSRAYYRRPPADLIVMPERGLFTGSATSSPTEAYYATKLHELGHWTGAEPRLDRTFGKRFGDNDYAFEELIAELTAAYLCAELGIANEPRSDHAQYLSSWLDVLRADSRAVFTAASQATRAVAYLNGLQPDVPTPGDEIGPAQRDNVPESAGNETATAPAYEWTSARPIGDAELAVTEPHRPETRRDPRRNEPIVETLSGPTPAGPS